LGTSTGKGKAIFPHYFWGLSKMQIISLQWIAIGRSRRQKRSGGAGNFIESREPGKKRDSGGSVWEKTRQRTSLSAPSESKEVLGERPRCSVAVLGNSRGKTGPRGRTPKCFASSRKRKGKKRGISNYPTCNTKLTRKCRLVYPESYAGGTRVPPRGKRRVLKMSASGRTQGKFPRKR